MILSSLHSLQRWWVFLYPSESSVETLPWNPTVGSRLLTENLLILNTKLAATGFRLGLGWFGHTCRSVTFDSTGSVGCPRGRLYVDRGPGPVARYTSAVTIDWLGPRNMDHGNNRWNLQVNAAELCYPICGKWLCIQSDFGWMQLCWFYWSVFVSKYFYCWLWTKRK